MIIIVQFQQKKSTKDVYYPYYKSNIILLLFIKNSIGEHALKMIMKLFDTGISS
jgi:hypothetical protein